MAKLKTDPITAADMVEFLDYSSDFGFELQVLNALVSLGFQCDHGGTYTDPVTERPRQYDIRATKIFHNCFIRMALECKNLRDNCPLLISCLPRSPEANYNDIYASARDDGPSFFPRKTTATFSHPIGAVAKAVRLRGDSSLYQLSTPVGKSSAQVGRDMNGNITSNDSDVYEKWAQAIASVSCLRWNWNFRVTGLA